MSVSCCRMEKEELERERLKTEREKLQLERFRHEREHEKIRYKDDPHARGGMKDR